MYSKIEKFKSMNILKPQIKTNSKKFKFIMLTPLTVVGGVWYYIGTENERRMKMKTTIEWFTPKEKTPRNGEVLALCTSGYITMVNCYKGHFNASSFNLDNEFDGVVMWAYPPQSLEKIAKEKWSELYEN